MSARMFVHLMGKKVECARNLVAAVAFPPLLKKLNICPWVGMHVSVGCMKKQGGEGGCVLLATSIVQLSQLTGQYMLFVPLIHCFVSLSCEQPPCSSQLGLAKS